MDYISWKQQDHSSLYNSSLIGRTTRTLLHHLRVLNTPPQTLRTVLELKRNFGGVANESLYAHSFYGTKLAVENFYEVLVEAVERSVEPCLDALSESGLERPASGVREEVGGMEGLKRDLEERKVFLQTAIKK
jgi:hypothetical protein